MILLQICFRIVEPGFVACCAVWVGNCFEVRFCLHLQGCEPRIGFLTLKMEEVHIFETSGNSTPNHTPQQPKDSVLQRSLDGNFKSLLQYC
jgi:hypothetical protein